VTVEQRATVLPLPSGEWFEERGLGRCEFTRPSHPLTRLAFGESPSPRWGEEEVGA
jgi:hypothetical protein